MAVGQINIRDEQQREVGRQDLVAAEAGAEEWKELRGLVAGVGREPAAEGIEGMAKVLGQPRGTGNSAAMLSCGTELCAPPYTQRLARASCARG